MTSILYLVYHTHCRRAKIIIAGYSKSGNTWLTRLVGEVVKCPVEGFWKAPDHLDKVREGINRVYEFVCYKTHKYYYSLAHDCKKDESPTFIIYVIRDPRDIAISGSEFFYFEKPYLQNIKYYLNYISPGQKLYNGLWKILQNTEIKESFYRLNKNERLNKMIETILYGDANTNKWCRKPWQEQLLPYLENQIFYIKYEDMINQPLQNCMRIADYLKIKRSKVEIEEAIFTQSFEQKKAKFKEKGDIEQVKFLRSGKTQQWKTQLNHQQNQKFISKIGDLLSKLDYEI